MNATRDAAAREHLDVLVIGAGLAGLYMTYRLARSPLTFATVETADDVGGTWYWNRYPGARCDVPSLEYSFSFDEELQQEWEWSERYATQPEILRYAQHVAERYGLREHIRFGTTVDSLTYDDVRERWTAETSDGPTYDARFVVTAVGCLSAPKPPEVPGLDSFGGRVLSTSSWPSAGVDLTGKRVGLIGTGSSGVQSIPVIAERAAELTVFQRTPSYSIPAHNAPLDPAQVAAYKREYAAHRAAARNTRTGVVIERGSESALEVSDEVRTRRFQGCWDLGHFACLNASFTDILTDERANETVAEFVRNKIRSAVADPQTAEDLTPRTYPFGTKRVCLDTGYYETFNRENVRLVNLRREPLEAITETGIRTIAAEYPVDVLVLATGFDAVTGALLRLDIRGRDGVRLADEWATGPRTYLGLQVAGFPNLFTITGPGSPSILSNVMVSIEQHVDWIVDTLTELRGREITVMEADRGAQEAWFEANNALAAATLYVKADSWFMGANVPGKPRYFLPYMGGLAGYIQICEDVRADGYRGFILRAAPVSATA